MSVWRPTKGVRWSGRFVASPVGYFGINARARLARTAGGGFQLSRGGRR